MHFSRFRWFFMVAVLGVGVLVAGQMPSVFALPASPNGWWRDKAEMTIPRNGQEAQRPVAYRTLEIDLATLQTHLTKAPREFTAEADTAPLVLDFPLPDGTRQRFTVVEYSMMEPGLAAQYPDWHTYYGQGIDDPTATLRMDITLRGLHAVMTTAAGTYYLDPYQRDDTAHYLLYDITADRRPRPTMGEGNDFDVPEEMAALLRKPLPAAPPTDGILRTYQLAMAATGEYTQYHGGTVDGAQAVIVTTVNRLNDVFEGEVSARFVLIDNNTNIIYIDPESDPYTNDDSRILVNENQINLDKVIGSANYDIGHVLAVSTNGGFAGFSVCAEGLKGRGATGTTYPLPYPGTIAGYAHEIGHQFTALHSFNGTTGPCGLYGFDEWAYEPGSGNTISAYPGLCGLENTSITPFLRFNAGSFEAIRTHITNPQGGDSCDTPIETNNIAPIVQAGPDHTIPAMTPFELVGAADDETPTSLTYSWEQFDLGTRTAEATVNTDLGDNPLFKMLYPSTNPLRTFPSLQYILDDSNTPPALISCPINPDRPDIPSFGECSPGETLPTTNRTMTMRLMVRDNQPNGGGVGYDTTVLTVNNTMGPFKVQTANTPGTLWLPGTSQTVTWDVANTTLAPVSCNAVDITLSTDGGETFTHVLANGTPNDGTESVTAPNISVTTARLKVKCANNIFFDINDSDFTVAFPTPTPTITLTPSVTPTLPPDVCAPVTIVVDEPLAPEGNICQPFTITTAGTVMPGTSVQVAVDHTAIGRWRMFLYHPASNRYVTMLSFPGFPTLPLGDDSNMVRTAPVRFTDTGQWDADQMGSTLGTDGVICRDDSRCDYFPNAGYYGDGIGNFAAFTGTPAQGQWQVCIYNADIAVTAHYYSATVDLACDATMITPTPTRTVTPSNTPPPGATLTPTPILSITPSNTPPPGATLTPVVPTPTWSLYLPLLQR